MDECTASLLQQPLFFHVAFRVAFCTDLNHKMLLYCL